MQIIIKHTRQGRDRTLELTPRHALMLVKAVCFVAATLWLLQLTVPVARPVPANPLAAGMPAWLAQQTGAGADEEGHALLASPVPGGVADTPAAAGAMPEEPANVESNWLVGVTQSWLERTRSANQDDLKSKAQVAEQALAAQAMRSAQLREQEHINLLARKIGEMEARLTRIDALGERLADLAGVAPETFDFRQPPGQGGLLVETQPMSIQALDQELDALKRRLAERSDYLYVLDARLTSQAAKASRTPSAMPILGYAYNSSSYGSRVDPFTGRRAYHEGLDFAAPRGTPILAAAGGMVVRARYLPGYGKLVELDHGNKLITRYAHASKIMVKEGDLVHRGQQIATVGSTGRSTGAHLHFEVRVAGRAVDPRRFLASEAREVNLANLDAK